MRDGFSKFYIDPHAFVPFLASRLKQYMNQYSEEYLAPYTSLISSSMMGKTRLMKELAVHMPLVYICLRKDESSGYPETTPRIQPWLRRAVTGDLGQGVTARQDLAQDRDFKIPVVRFLIFL